MDTKQATNLAKVSKKSVLNVEVFENEKYSKFTHAFKVPFKKLEERIPARRLHLDVIDTFSDVIIAALEERMETCVDMVSSNLFNIAQSNEYHILFKKEDGSYHGFNHASFRNMQEVIHLIKEARFEDLEKKHYTQILKALYWIEKPEPRNGVCFGDLISACVEIVATTYG